MKRFFGIIVLVMLMTGIASAAATLTNGGFESGSLSGWTLTGSGYATANDNWITAAEGTYFIRLNSNGSSLSQSGTDDLVVGTTFTLTGYARGDGGDYGTASIVFYDSSDDELDSTSIDISTGEWTSFSISLDAVDNAAYWSVMLESTYGAGNYVDVYFDGLELTTSYDNGGSTVPVPGAVFLLGSGLVGLTSLRRQRKV